MTKYRPIIIILLLVMLLSPQAKAASIGSSIKSPGKLKITAALEDSYIFERDIDSTANIGRFDIEELNQYYLKLIWGLYDNFHTYFKLGQSNSGEVRQRLTDSTEIEIETHYDLLWGLGANFSYEFIKKLYAGVDIQYNHCKADVDELHRDNRTATSITGEITNWEFQTALYVATDCTMFDWDTIFTPYAAITYNKFTTKTDNDITYTVSGTNYSSSWDTDGGDNIGFILGVDMQLTNNITANIEGHIIDEDAVTFGLAYNF